MWVISIYISIHIYRVRDTRVNGAFLVYLFMGAKPCETWMIVCIFGYVGSVQVVFSAIWFHDT